MGLSFHRIITNIRAITILISLDARGISNWTLKQKSSLIMNYEKRQNL